ncbi:hypothetical protein G6F63_014842 [Rhizopus arrhizus]|nr:hypothetical protein G6F63_014842 [Rhizopus arrhizus]
MAVVEQGRVIYRHAEGKRGDGGRIDEDTLFKIASNSKAMTAAMLARLVQRMAIPSWRALRFPGNGAYILRSRAAATALFNELYDEWSRGAR